MKKKLIGILSICFVFIFALSGCGSSGTSSSAKKPVKASEVNDLFKNPDDYKGRSFTFNGKIFNVGDDYIQVWYDIENSDKDVYVHCSDKLKSSLKEDDYVKVKATIDGKATGENLLGGKVETVEATAKSIKKINATDAIAVSKSVDVNQAVTQGSVVATVTKVDFTKSGYLRIYVTVQNNGSSEADVYPDQGAVVQNGKQIESDYSSEDYPEVASPISAGATSSGVILYKTSDQSSFTYSFDGYDAEMNELKFSYNIQVQ